VTLLTFALNREIGQTSCVGGWDTAPKCAPGTYVPKKPFAQKDMCHMTRPISLSNPTPFGGQANSCAILGTPPPRLSFNNVSSLQIKFASHGSVVVACMRRYLQQSDAMLYFYLQYSRLSKLLCSPNLFRAGFLNRTPPPPTCRYCLAPIRSPATSLVVHAQLPPDWCLSARRKCGQTTKR